MEVRLARATSQGHFSFAFRFQNWEIGINEQIAEHFNSGPLMANFRLVDFIPWYS